MDQSQYFEIRAEESEKKIEEIRNFLGENQNPDSTVFITGSLGRLESRTNSDLDLFLFSNNQSIKNQTLLRHMVFSCQEKLKFPELTERFLNIHKPDDVAESTGGSDDDFSNNLTARMLLLF